MTQHPKPSLNTALILNWIFIPGLLLLLLNDHYLKFQFSGWITGKLSDFIGLLIFPMFLQFLFPRLGRYPTVITGLSFILWKLPISGPVIDLYNKVAIIPITRTVDYTDLIALSILPLTDYLIRNIDRYKLRSIKYSINPRLATTIVLIPATIIFMATEPPIGFRESRNGEILIGKTYRLKMSREEALTRIKAFGSPVEKDSLIRPWRTEAFYVMKNIVLPGEKDTIQSIDFSIITEGEKTFLGIWKIKISDGPIPQWRRAGRYYRRLIHSDLVEEVKQPPK